MIGTIINTVTILIGSIIGGSLRKGIEEKHQSALYNSMWLAACGIGIAFSAVVLFLWQGSIYLLAGYLSSFLTTDLMTEITLIGGFLILSSGLSILKIKDCNTLNMLPSLCVPIVWFILKTVL